MPVLLPLAQLKALANPFGIQTPWGVKVTQNDVRRALGELRLVATPGGEDHAGRIAYLVLNRADDAISLDIGCPAFGTAGTTWPVLDGNHRLAAAIYRKDKVIAGVVDGCLDYALEVFGIDCEEPGLPRHG